MTTSLNPQIPDACSRFKEVFGHAPRSFGQAPARVELLGNHTDYNGGLVMAAAVDRGTIVVGERSPGRTARVHAAHFAALDEFSVDAIEPGPAGAWERYVRGVCWALDQAHGPFTGGFDAVILGDVPLGAGLSSSASLQTALSLFLFTAEVVEISRGADFDQDAAWLALARTLNRSENEFVGVGSGLLDQFSCLFGRRGHAVYLDCATLAFDRLPLGRPGPAIVVCDSRTSRRLADGKYDERRGECDRAAAGLRRSLRREAAASLSSFQIADLELAWDSLDTVARKRARHVLSENERVRQGVAALRGGDLKEFSRLISASHDSSRDDFENSSPALDRLIECAESAPGFLGGKLTGAGWAGCTVNLVRAERAGDFAASVREDYQRTSGVLPLVHVCQSTDGAMGGTL